MAPVAIVFVWVVVVPLSRTGTTDVGVTVSDPVELQRSYGAAEGELLRAYPNLKAVNLSGRFNSKINKRGAKYTVAITYFPPDEPLRRFTRVVEAPVGH